MFADKLYGPDFRHVVNPIGSFFFFFLNITLMLEVKHLFPKSDRPRFELHHFHFVSRAVNFLSWPEFPHLFNEDK